MPSVYTRTRIIAEPESEFLNIPGTGITRYSLHSHQIIFRVNTLVVYQYQFAAVGQEQAGEFTKRPADIRTCHCGAVL